MCSVFYNALFARQLTKTGEKNILYPCTLLYPKGKEQGCLPFRVGLADNPKRKTAGLSLNYSGVALRQLAEVEQEAVYLQTCLLSMQFITKRIRKYT